MSDDNRDDLKWEEVKVEHIITDEWIDFRRLAYRMPDGTVFEPYYSYSRKDYVIIVATDEDGDYLCVRQFRQGIREVTTEFPAGGIERNGGLEYRDREDNDGSEEALNAAKRELREETGYTSDEWSHLLTVPSNATIADNYAHIYMARNCRLTADQKLDDTEFLNVEKHSENEIKELIRSGKFQQAMHITAYLLSKNDLSVTV
ncbi:MAG: NUDIX hydrolase [Lachnospiraceae bacterium]|nr:NUDIX hydrolase [Lachnospiraceae bacterium]